MSDRGSIERYLAALFGHAPAGSFIEVRWRTPSGMNRCFIDVADRSGAASSITDRAARTDVYGGVLPRGCHRGGRADLVPEARVLWADCDTRESVDALRTFPAPPSIVMRSALWTTATPTGSSPSP